MHRPSTRNVPRLLKTLPSEASIKSSMAAGPRCRLSGRVVDRTAVQIEVSRCVGLISIPPLALSALAPESVPAVSVTRPLTVTSPVPVRVPPVIDRVLSIVDAEAIDSVPPEIVSGSVEVRLLIESVDVIGMNHIRGDVDRDVVA